MRKATKLSLTYLLVFVATFIAAKQTLPEQLDTFSEQLLTAVFAVLFFIFLPALYWRWVIKVGNKKAWRLIIAFSLSSFAARYTFPEDIARYFEFIAWLRFPLIAILVLIELALMFSIVRVLWQSRHMSGDPRLTMFKTYEDKPAEHLDLALAFSYEPSSWYYAVPYFSRKHVKPLAKLELRSASRWSLIANIVGLIAASTLSYFALQSLSELLAIVVSSFLFYCVVMTVANYRVSRHYPIYVDKERLVINNNFLNLLVVNLNEIESITTGQWSRDKQSEELFLGSGEHANIEIRFRSPQKYYGLLGLVTETVDSAKLSINRAEDLTSLLEILPEPVA
ncbi:MAG: hypothetical protein AB8G18_17570 [Gammaproteobacteria bacterium]